MIAEGWEPEQAEWIALLDGPICWGGKMDQDNGGLVLAVMNTKTRQAWRVTPEQISKLAAPGQLIAASILAGVGMLASEGGGIFDVPEHRMILGIPADDAEGQQGGQHG